MRSDSVLRRGAGVVALAALLSAPSWLTTHDIGVLATAASLGIAALGLDLLVGGAGQLSLATAAFFGVGCYATLFTGSRGLPWPAAMLVGAAAASLACAFVGLPSLRIKGLQVAVATLAFQIAILLVPDTFPVVKGRADGLPRPGFLASDQHFYYLALGCVALVVVVLQRIRTTKAGRLLIAVRDVEDRAVAFGVAPGRTKVLAYALSGAVVGLGGAVFALQQTTVDDTTDFRLNTSLLLVAVVVLGGARSWVGVLIGAFLVFALPHLLPATMTIPVLGDPSQSVPILFTLGLVVSVVRQPEGIAGALRALDGSLTRAAVGAPERPVPRPMPTDAMQAVRHAAALRQVPRGIESAMPVRTMLEARAVSVRYGGVRALDDLSMEVRRGEIVGLIGANGAGKSTFFNAVSGMAPVTGSIRFRDRELVGARPARRGALGVARTFQDMGLVRGDTVRENLLLAQTWLARYPSAPGILGLWSAVPVERELRRRSQLALELFGLDHLAGEQLGSLPYGTMRAVEIAAAVASGPDLLLLDEASAGLTPDEKLSLAERFRALRSELGLTLVIIEHHVPLIVDVCDYAYALESGRLIAHGHPADVITHPEVVESFLGRGSLDTVGAGR